MVDTGVVDREGFLLEWAREGRGLPMLVVGSQRYYRRVFPAAMRDQFEIVFCDSRQWVRTPDSFDIFTITLDAFCDDVEAVRQVTGLDRPVVVGHSQHGAIALEYARRYRACVRGVVAVAAVPPFGSEVGLEPADDFFGRDASPQRLAAHERNRAERRVPATVQTPQDFVDDYVSRDAMNWYDYNFNCSPLWDGVEINLPVAYQFFAPEGLGRYGTEGLDVPVFLALGRTDYGIPYYLWDRPKQHLPKLHFKLYEQSGHTPPYEQPVEFSHDVAEWAAGLEPES